MNSLPTVMLAIDPLVPGDPDVLVTVERPVPMVADSAVLLRVGAAGVNGGDLFQRRGAYPPPAGAPTIPGLEVAGVVVAVGRDVDAAWVGRRACAIVAGGGYAEYVAIDARHLLPVPDGVTLVEAAAIPEALFTVWTNVFEHAYASEGDWLLCHGGNSGIGTMAIQLARAFGLRSIVTCRNDALCAQAVALGAGAALNRHALHPDKGGLQSEVMRLTEGRGVNVVLDMLGGDWFPHNLACLADEGRHVTISVLAGPKAMLFLPEVMRKRLTVTGSTLRGRPAAFKATVTQEILTHVWPLIAERRIVAVIDSVFPLAEAASAHRRLEEGGHFGKVVLTMDGIDGDGVDGVRAAGHDGD